MQKKGVLFSVFFFYNLVSFLLSCNVLQKSQHKGKSRVVKPGGRASLLKGARNMKCETMLILNSILGVVYLNVNWMRKKKSFVFSFFFCQLEAFLLSCSVSCKKASTKVRDMRWSQVEGPSRQLECLLLFISFVYPKKMQYLNCKSNLIAGTVCKLFKFLHIYTPPIIPYDSQMLLEFKISLTFPSC